MKKGFSILRSAIRVLSVPVLLLALAGFLLTQPSCAHFPETKESVSADRLRDHVEVLSVELAPRNYTHPDNLNACAVYIANQLKAAGAEVSEQVFEVEGSSYRNIIAMFGPESTERIVVGAHYDSCGTTPGADDNASGTAGLIELAGLLGRTELKQQVELVAYTLEEPPFFATMDMGSAHHAAALRANGVKVEAMICIEMIGYFSDAKKSQRFPSPLLNLFYPDEGNSIAVLGGFSDRKLIRRVRDPMRGATDLPVYSMCAPRNYGGLDFSDHRNYWQNDYKAVMVTDTAFFRNTHYHKLTDVADSLDYDRMAKVVLGVYEAVVRLANED